MSHFWSELLSVSALLLCGGKHTWSAGALGV